MNINVFNKINTLYAAALNQDERIKIDVYRVKDRIEHESFYNQFKYAFDTYNELGSALFRGDRKLEYEYDKEVSKWAREEKRRKDIERDNYDEDDAIVNQVVFGLTPGVRKSENTFNFYTKLFSDVLESWKDFPKRNNSIICTTSEGKASTYAGNEAFCLFPKNDVKIAICPANDLWDSFYDSINTSLDDFNVCFYSAVKAYIPEYLDTLEKAVVTYGSNDEIFEIFEALEENIKHNKQVREQLDDDVIIVKNFIEPVIDGEHLYDHLNRTLNPISNGFKLTGNTDDIVECEDNEVWFSGKCLAVYSPILDDLM